MARARAEGVWHVVFGDLFFEDIRAYREKQLAACGMTPFPVVGQRYAAACGRNAGGRIIGTISRAWTRENWTASFAGRRFDAQLAGGFAGGCRSVRGKWRVSQLRERGADVPREDSGERGRDCGAGGICVRGFVAGGAGGKRESVVLSGPKKKWPAEALDAKMTAQAVARNRSSRELRRERWALRDQSFPELTLWARFLSSLTGLARCGSRKEVAVKELRPTNVIRS